MSGESACVDDGGSDRQRNTGDFAGGEGSSGDCGESHPPSDLDSELAGESPGCRAEPAPRATPDTRPADVQAIIRQIDELARQLPLDIGAAVNDPLGGGLFGELLSVNDRLYAALAQVAAQVNRDGMWALDGSRSCVGHLIRNYPIAPNRAKMLCRTGALLRDHLQPTAEALREGRLGWDAGLEMTRRTTTSPERLAALDATIIPEPGPEGEPDPDPAPEALDTVADPESDAATGPIPDAPEPHPETAAPVRCEEWLIEQGRQLTASEFALLLRHWAARVDPESDERGYKDVEAAEFFTASETLDCFHLEGKLTVEHGKVLVTALRHLIGVPAKNDKRPAVQRNAHALVGLARLALEQNFDSRASAARPHISLVLPWHTFRAMAGAAGTPDEQLAAIAKAEPATWAEGDGPIPPSLLATLACDSDITRMVFGPGNQLINLGRTDRIVSPGLRSAVIARDRHCAYPRCDAPPALCEVHHLDRWIDGGCTNADNLALLCWWHHRWIHANGVTVRPAGRGPADQRSQARNGRLGRQRSEATGNSKACTTIVSSRRAHAFDFISRNGQRLE